MIINLQFIGFFQSSPTLSLNFDFVFFGMKLIKQWFFDTTKCAPCANLKRNRHLDQTCRVCSTTSIEYER